jgi:hypothetical protein
VTVAIAWTFSFAGSAFMFIVGVPLPDWLAAGLLRESLLRSQAIGLVVAWLLALLVVRLWSAPPQLWLGAVAASLILAAPYATHFLEYRSGNASSMWHEGRWWVLQAPPFLDPYAALLALVGYPLVVGLACWLGSRRRAGEVVAPPSEQALHA